MNEKNSEKVSAKCVIQEILDIIGGKWSMSIIFALLDGTKRFNELQKLVTNINTRMLVKELKNMEENEIVIREVFATVPPTVQYTLTEKGRKLEPSLMELLKWGEEFVN